MRLSLITGILNNLQEARQAGWALFFTCFQFTVTYHPRHKNQKADALSRIYNPDPSPSVSEPILPPTIIISPNQWAIDDQIAEIMRSEPAPQGGPEGRLCDPSALRLCLMDLVHTSLGSLVPLLVPHSPWSHVGIDFLSDLPPSVSRTCVLVIANRLFKVYKLILLKGLLTVLETAEVLFQNIFRHFGITDGIVSDHGPQSISRVWQAFFQLLGITVSLSFGMPSTRAYCPKVILT